MPNELTTKPQQGPMQRFKAQLYGVNAQNYINDVMKDPKARENFMTSLISVVAASQNLQKCNPMSVFHAAMKSVPLGLPIESSLGYAAVIPYGTNASFQIMRNGWMELLMRTGQVRFVANEVVHKGELVKKNKFTGEYIFDEDKRESDEEIGYMAYVKLNNGFEKTVYWSIEEVRAHALRYSETYKKGYGNWKDNFSAMALKTVLKHLIVKYCPKSAELRNALREDQTVTDENNYSTYADNPQREAEWQDQPEPSETAKAKAEQVKAKVEQMKSRQNKPAEPEPVNTETGEVEDMPMFPDGE